MDASPTLDQVQVFLAVAETGSFSAAGRRLNRAQSAVSYAIANLEAQLKLKLFDREGTREPALTQAGQSMLPDARRMIGVLSDMRARADGITRGLEPKLAVTVDVSLPSPVLLRVLKAFEAEFPTVEMDLNIGALGILWDHIVTRRSDLSFGGPPQRLPPELASIRLGGASMTPVAAPSHPLALHPGRVPLEVVREHIQLVVSDPSSMTKGKDFGVFAYRTWRMTDMNTKHQLILSGLGWGGLPTWMVEDDIAAGRLVALDLEPYPVRIYSLFAYHRIDTPLGPAACWMVDRFKAELG